MNQESSEIIENVATSLPVYSIPTVPPPIMPNVPSDPAAHVLEPYPMPKPTPIHPVSQCIRIKRSYQNVNSMGSYPEFEVAYPSELSQHQVCTQPKLAISSIIVHFMYRLTKMNGGHLFYA